MPCQFSGIFYVTYISDRFTINCTFVNEHQNSVLLTMTFFHIRTIADSAPSAIAYERVEANKVYFFTGTCAVKHENFAIPEVYSNVM